ncbi:MAG: hypothetical protein FJX57_01245 [Alphaproteobacteria bacterium]|nr:hypothetical protein [Alphaproteobacteria bacterium]
MASALDMLMIQFLAWLEERPRGYRETMDAWRTSCPRLSVWEDATIDGLVEIQPDAARTVVVTAKGRARLRAAA